MCMAATAENDSGESASGSTQKSLKRACDCCRKRKVRCDGESPCGPCRKATIRCAYLQAPKKKGPKGLRSARVLHALRKIDQSASLTPDGPLSPGALQDGLNQWYGSSSSSPIPLPNHNTIDSAMPTSTSAEPLTTGYGYYGPPEPQSYAMIPQMDRRVLPLDQSMSQLWPSQPSQPQQSYYAPPLRPQPTVPRIPNQRFLPYVQLFFEHLYFIMPVVDEQIYLDPYMYNSTNYMPPETYAFLCALCAATIVQLDAATRVPEMEPLPGRPTSAADMFIEECLKVRQEIDYIGNSTTITVMTSFFIFAYYGNKERSDKAWHYLQEAISFAENLEMDDENSMLKLDPLEAQWRRRLYWLLFITERYFPRLHAFIVSPADIHAQSILHTTPQKLPTTSHHRATTSLRIRRPSPPQRFRKPSPPLFRHRRQFRQHLERQRPPKSLVFRTLASRNTTLSRHGRALSCRDHGDNQDRHQCVEGMAAHSGLADGRQQRLGMRQRTNRYWTPRLPHRSRPPHRRHCRASESSCPRLPRHRHGAKAFGHRWLSR